MTISGTNNYLNNMNTSYESNNSKTKGKDDALGRDAFLTMMVAQLQNQDPLSPMDGTEFSSQLAQFSQLEQLLNLNETMTSLKASFDDNSTRDVTGYIGKEVVGNVDSMSIKNGTASEGFYTLAKPGEVRAQIYDSKGKLIKTLYLGQQNMGGHSIKWDGTDSSGATVSDGTYTYSVDADMGYGFEKVATTVTGIVEGVVYSGDKPFLVVDGVWVNPDSLVQVRAGKDSNDSSILDYLGKNITSSSPLVQVKNSDVQGSDLSFELSKKDSVIIGIYNSSNELIRTIGIAAADTTKGANSVNWDGRDNDGKKVKDGIYSYDAVTPSGNADIKVTDHVSGIKSIAGTRFLVLDATGRLALASSITNVN